MKHAYLILAHNNFKVLEMLVHCLDDSRNDIFIHFDAKLKTLPEIHTEKAGLTILTDRVDVRWADWTVVEAEYKLYNAAAAKGPYAYYHLLSGVDLPVKTQDEIHKFFDDNAGKEFIGYTLLTITPELERKAQRWHLFPRSFRNGPIWIRAIRAGFLRVQEFLGIRRNCDIDMKKGSQWASVTDGMVHYILDHYEWAKKRFTHTYCSDEIVKQTLCWMSPYKENIYRTDDDGLGCVRVISWFDGEMKNWTKEDYLSFCEGSAMFARKFTDESLPDSPRI